MSRRVNAAMADLRRRVAALDAALQTVEVVLVDGSEQREYGEDVLVIRLAPAGFDNQQPLCEGLWTPMPEEMQPVVEDPEIAARRRLGLLN